MLALLLLPTSFSSSPPACTVTISPGDSLHDAAASLLPGGVACLGPGVHRLHGRPLEPTADHTTWVSSDASSPAIISGGVQLSNWQPCAAAAACPPGVDGVWQHSMAGLNISASMLPVRQLWADDARATRRGRAHTARGP